MLSDGGCVSGASSWLSAFSRARSIAASVEDGSGRTMVGGGERFSCYVTSVTTTVPGGNLARRCAKHQGTHTSHRQAPHHVYHECSVSGRSGQDSSVRTRAVCARGWVCDGHTTSHRSGPGSRRTMAPPAREFRCCLRRTHSNAEPCGVGQIKILRRTDN
eukprot:6069099-Prymnesium_polylepis.2